MNLKKAYEDIWAGKLTDIQHPREQSIERVDQTSNLWKKHFGSVDRLNGPLLDCGTGSGAMLAKAEAAGIKAKGVEFNREVAKWLKGMDYDVSVVDLSSGSLPAAEHGWQIVTSCDVIEHLIDPFHMLKEIYRVLADGGHAYISTPNASFWKRVQELRHGRMFRTSGDFVLKDGGHLSYWGPQDLIDALKGAGFRDIGIEYRNQERAPANLRAGEWSDHAYMIAWAMK